MHAHMQVDGVLQGRTYSVSLGRSGNNRYINGWSSADRAQYEGLRVVGYRGCGEPGHLVLVLSSRLEPDQLVEGAGVWGACEPAGAAAAGGGDDSTVRIARKGSIFLTELDAGARAMVEEMQHGSPFLLGVEVGAIRIGSPCCPCLPMLPSWGRMGPLGPSSWAWR